MPNYDDCDILRMDDYSDCDVLYITDVGGAYNDESNDKAEVSEQDDKSRHAQLTDAINSYELGNWEYPALEYIDTGYTDFGDIIETFAPIKPDIGSLANEVFNLGGFYLLGQELCRMSDNTSCYKRTDEKTLRNFVRDICVTSRIYENFYTTGKFNEIKERIESLCRLWGLCILDEDYRELQLKGFSNGVFDFNKMTFIKKAEHNYVRFPVFHALKCPYVPIAERKGKTDGYRELLTAISGGNEKLSRFIDELIAKVLVERRNGKRLFWIVDPNGFLYELLKLFFVETLGAERVSTVTLSKLKESKLFALDGAMVNLSCDAGLAKLSTTDFPLSQILSSNIVTYSGSKKASFSNGVLSINVTKMKSYLPAELKKVCAVIEISGDCKNSAECAFEKIKPELPCVVSHLLDTIFASMLERDPEQTAPDESLIASLSIAEKVDTVDICLDNYFLTGACEVIIKKEAYNLYAEYTEANGYEPIGQYFFYKGLRNKNIKADKMVIVDKATGETIGKRTVFVGLSHINLTYALSPIEIEKMNVKNKE